MDQVCHSFGSPRLLTFYLLVWGLLQMPLGLTGQRIFSGQFLVEQMELDPVLEIDLKEDWNRTVGILDSLEKAKEYGEEDYEWLCLQVVRVLSIRELEGHAEAEMAARKFQGSPSAKPNTFAKRALMMFEAVEHYWFNPGLGPEGTARALEAIELSKQAGDQQLEFDLSLFIASIYLDYRRSDLAWEWLEKAKALLPAIEDPLNCHIYYLTSAEAYLPDSINGEGRRVWESKLDEAQAFACVEEAIACGEEAFALGSGMECDVGLAYQLRSKFWREPEEQLYYARKAIPYNKSRNKIALGYSYADLTEIHIKLNNLEEAANYLDSAKVLEVAGGDFPPHLARYYMVCVGYFNSKGGPADSLLKYQKLLASTQAEVMRAREVAELDKYKFQYQETQQKLVILRQQVELEERKMNNRNLLITIVAFGLILVLILGAWLRIRQRNKLIQEKSEEIEEMVEELGKNLKEKTILIQEVNHRVKNNLQMINAFIEIQARNVEEGETAEFAEGIRRRVRAVGIVHELIQESMFSGMSFEEYALQLIAELESLYHEEGNAFRCEMDIAALNLDVSTNMYLGILLNELVSNSMKHASKEGQTLVVWISLKQVGSELVLSYRDSGDGLPAVVFNQKDQRSGVGLVLIEAMVRQVEGKAEYQTGQSDQFRLVWNQLDWAAFPK